MAKGGTLTLNELMGGRGAEFGKNGIELSDLPSLLGEGMPKLEFHALGRVRLIKALHQRFGEGYRSVPGVQELMRQFDREAGIEKKHHEIKMRLGRK